MIRAACTFNVDGIFQNIYNKMFKKNIILYVARACPLLIIAIKKGKRDYTFSRFR